MSRKRWIRAAIALLALAVLLLPLLAWARPGGGDSYGGGGGGGDGGGGGGGGGDGSGIAIVFVYLIQFAFEYPAIGVPVLILFTVVVIWGVRAKAKMKHEWTAGVAEARGQRQQAMRIAKQGDGPSAARRLEGLRAVDPNYSQVLFEDFLYALYAEVHRSRGLGQIEALSAYLTPQARAKLQRDAGLTEVKGVIIGAMRFVSARGVEPGSPGVNVEVEFESNFVEVTSGHPRTYYTRETWSLFRKAGVQSRTPDRARNITCPKCGAPLTDATIRGGTCAYCQTQVGTGEFDWLVTDVRVHERQQRAPQLTADVEEVGTDWPTVVDPEAKARFAALCQRDPSFTWPGLEARVKKIHAELNAGWTARDFTRVRPYVTDNLFQMQMYWIEAYRAAGLKNQLDGARVLAVEAAKVVNDSFYDALTVRVHATGLDYVVRDSGGIVRGSDTEERRFTEYWTLVRGAKARGPSRTDPACPNCGGPLKIAMTGNCEFCHAKVTAGDFDWILSRIEQDESYGG